MRRWSLVVCMALALVASACSGSGDVVDLEEAAPAEETSSTTEATTTTSTTTTTEPAAPSTDPADAVIETWTTLLDAARTGAPDADQLATIEALAGPATVEQLLAPLFPEASGREIEFFPALTEQGDGTWAIDDCLVMSPGISVGISNWLVGAAEPADDSPTGWRISGIQVINLDPCVPRSIADAAIAGYEAYNDAQAVFYDPPDPENPLVEETTTGSHQLFVLDLIDDLASNGQVLRGRAATVPEFSAIDSLEEVVIIDCQEVDLDFGVYVEATGERTDRITAIDDGELDLVEATMQLEGGTWKVSDYTVEGDVACRTPPTPETLRIAGG